MWPACYRNSKLFNLKAINVIDDYAYFTLIWMPQSFGICIVEMLWSIFGIFVIKWAPTDKSRAAESTNFRQLRLRLRPENIDSDCNSDSDSTPAQQQLFHPKKEQYGVPIFFKSILIASKWVIRQYSTCLRLLQMQPVVLVVIIDPF